MLGLGKRLTNIGTWEVLRNVCGLSADLAYIYGRQSLNIGRYL